MYVCVVSLCDVLFNMHITAGLMESSIEVLRNLHTKLCMSSLDGGKKKVQLLIITHHPH